MKLEYLRDSIDTAQRQLTGHFFKEVVKELRGLPDITVHDELIAKIDHDNGWPWQFDRKERVEGLFSYLDAKIAISIGYGGRGITFWFPQITQFKYYPEYRYVENRMYAREIAEIKRWSWVLDTEVKLKNDLDEALHKLAAGYKRWKAKQARVDKGELEQETYRKQLENQMKGVKNEDDGPVRAV